MNKKLFISFFLLPIFNCNSQTVYRHEVFNGGVCVAGFSTALGVGQGQVELYIEPGSQIKSALLLSYTYGANTEGVVKLNSESFTINSSNLVTSNLFLNQFYSPINLHIKDITEWYTSNLSLNPIFETTVHPEMPFRGVFAPLIYIEYFNDNMPSINSVIIVNNQPIYGLNDYNIAGLNPILIENSVGFSLYTDRIGFSQNKYTDVSFNSNYIGTVFGADQVNSLWQVGVKGHFYYQNNTLFGLDDDLPNNVMNESDGLADVSVYINNLATNVNFQLEQINYPNILSTSINSFLAYFLTYTSPCQPFETTLLTSDTTTCANSPIQLGVTSTGSVNASFEWLPQTNLSCYDCPNPIFTGDSTINYTVRIWSSDSCSVVLPVRVRVVPSVALESVFGTASLCGLDAGTLLASAYSDALPISYQINDGEPQESGLFTNVAAGSYTVTAINAVGCTSSLLGVVNELNNIQAAFSVNPSTGEAPLEVQTQNNSQNATQYQWFWEDQSSTLTNPSITLDTAGVYTLTLVAGNGTAHCKDTASVMILVREPFEVFAYTFVTNEANVYQIYLSGVSDYKYDLYTLDGKLVYQKSGAVENAGVVDLWEIGRVASGMYLFRIWVKSAGGVDEVVEGKVVVVQ